jgi:membrane protein YqaA with SNARE-associated domain
MFISNPKINLMILSIALIASVWYQAWGFTAIFTIYASLFAASFFAATVLPLTSDAVIIYMASSGHNIFAIALVAAAGSYLGSCTTYLVGYYSREKILEDRMKIKEKKFAKYHRIFEKYGAPVLLFSWVPVAGDILVAIAGVLEINFKIFSFYALVGKISRFFIAAYLASRI